MAVALLWLATALGTGAAGAEQRVALVVGNATYAESRLKNPRNDALLMARALSATGFDVMTVMDGNAEDMRQAISEFGSKLQQPGAVALFYYAGHGVQIDGDNYLIPLGARISDASDVTEFGVPLQSVMRTMARSGTRLNIVIMDACRDNPFAAGGWSAAVTGLASVVAPADTIIAYATGPGQLAEDGVGPNSPYTAALASEMLAVGATLEDVFRATRRHVLERTGNRQTPWEHSSLISQFSFLPKVLTATAAEPSLPDLRLAEIEAWETIKATADPDMLRAHMQKYPSGLFAELAGMRLAKLEAVRTLTPWSWVVTSGLDVAERRAAADVVYARALALDGATGSHDDLKAALKLFSEAAADGHAGAMYRVGRAYDKARGVAKDLLAAARWYERAAEAGDAAAMAALGTMHEFGEGAAPDLAEALRLYRSAADRGDASGMTSLAFLYGEGKGVARNTSEARRLYSAAAALNHPRAIYNLALMELRGVGARADVQRARVLLEQASDLGHASATLELARQHDLGRWGVRSPARAAELALKAVQSGHKDGRFFDISRQGFTYATRREIQKQLAARGLYDGGIHGFFNSATLQALTAVAQR